MAFTHSSPLKYPQLELTLTNDVLYVHKHTKHQLEQCLFNPVTTGLQYSIMQISQELHHVVTGNRLNTIPSFTQTEFHSPDASQSRQQRSKQTCCVFSCIDWRGHHLPASPSLLTVLLCLYLRENERERGALERERAIYSSATISYRASARITHTHTHTHTHSSSLPLFPLHLSILPFIRQWI